MCPSAPQRGEFADGLDDIAVAPGRDADFVDEVPECFRRRGARVVGSKRFMQLRHVLAVDLRGVRVDGDGSRGRRLRLCGQLGLPRFERGELALQRRRECSGFDRLDDGPDLALDLLEFPAPGIGVRAVLGGKPVELAVELRDELLDRLRRPTTRL